MLTPLENDGKHINNIIQNHTCGRHAKDAGVPCYTLFNSFGKLNGVCGKRIFKAGYNGKISLTSMQLKKSSNII